jgi:hypothetical protein
VYILNIEVFLRSTKELYDVVSTQSVKSPDNSFGDWKFIKSELKNGDYQAIIYRRITEVNIVYNKLNNKKIEAFFSLNKNFDPILFDGVINYVKDFKLPKLDNDDRIVTTIFFDEIEDFNVFVYKYLSTNF